MSASESRIGVPIATFDSAPGVAPAAGHAIPPRALQAGEVTTANAEGSARGAGVLLEDLRDPEQPARTRIRASVSAPKLPDNTMIGRNRAPNQTPVVPLISIPSTGDGPGLRDADVEIGVIPHNRIPVQVCSGREALG